MQTKSHYLAQITSFISRFNDLRFVGQVIFVVIVLLISWSGIKTIQTNYGLQRQISGLKQQTAVQQLQNNNLALQNQYYSSDQYLGLAARQNFGLASPGEKEVLVPQSVALAYTASLPVASVQTPASHQPAYQHHLQDWLHFFLHRQVSN